MTALASLHQVAPWSKYLYIHKKNIGIIIAVVKRELDNLTETRESAWKNIKSCVQQIFQQETVQQSAIEEAMT
jgi:hypothetical protein